MNTTETCCICLDMRYFTECINQTDNNNIKYVEKLQNVLPNELWDVDLSICTDCIEKLDFVHEFFQICIKSEAYRKETRIKKESVKKEEYFQCNDCGKQFKLKRTLKSHITRIHLRKQCEYLDKRDNESTQDNIKEKSEIKSEEHALNNEENESDDSIKLENESDASIKLENEPSLNTDDNNSDFEEKLHTETKLRKKPKGKKKEPLNCEYCGLSFNRKVRFLEHVRAKHTFEKPYKCDSCDAAYHSNSKLSVHKRKHNDENPYICTTCGKSFRSSNHIWHHMKIHNNQRPYKCTECDRSFKTHNNLRTHKQHVHVNPDDWKHECKICGKRFPINSSLILHVRRHEGIRKYGCHICEKRFVDRPNLLSHILSHSKERFYKCNMCGKEYRKNMTLKRHLKKDHNIGDMVIKKPEKNLTCPMCPKAFAFNNRLQRHILTHTGEKPVKCNICDKSFRDNYGKNMHYRKEHNIDNYCN